MKIFVFLTSFLLATIIYSENYSLEIKKNETYYILAQSGIVLRNKPGFHAQKIDIIPYNTQIKVLEINPKIDTYEGLKNNWVKISYKNQKGFIFGGLLSRFQGPEYDTKSLSDYAEQTFKKQEETTTNNGKEETDDYHSETVKNYSDDIQLTISEGYETFEIKLSFSSLTLQEAYLIIVNLDSRYSSKKFTDIVSQEPENGITVCYRQDEDHGCVDAGECYYIQIEIHGITISTSGGC